MQMPVRHHIRWIQEQALKLPHQRGSLFLHLWNWPCGFPLTTECGDIDHTSPGLSLKRPVKGLYASCFSRSCFCAWVWASRHTQAGLLEDQTYKQSGVNPAVPAEGTSCLRDAQPKPAQPPTWQPTLKAWGSLAKAVHTLRTTPPPYRLWANMYIVCYCMLLRFCGMLTLHYWATDHWYRYPSRDVKWAAGYMGLNLRGEAQEILRPISTAMNTGVPPRFSWRPSFLRASLTTSLYFCC